MARQFRAFWLVLSALSGFRHTDRFGGNGHSCVVFLSFRKLANSKTISGQYSLVRPSHSVSKRLIFQRKTVGRTWGGGGSTKTHLAPQTKRNTITSTWLGRSRELFETLTRVTCIVLISPLPFPGPHWILQYTILFKCELIHSTYNFYPANIASVHVVLERCFFLFNQSTCFCRERF